MAFDFKSIVFDDTLGPKIQQLRARDGAFLSYRHYESDNKQKVFFLLHGSGGFGAYFHPLATHLSAVGEVFVPNLRGHYGSGKKRGDCAYIGQLEDDLYDFIEQFHLQDKDIFLVGHSSGGGLAIRFANSQYGKLIRGFVLLSPAIPNAPTLRKAANGWADLSIVKLIAISILNTIGIKLFNHATIIRFKMPKELCNGKETLSYSYNLNVSYHPRHPYQRDIAALKERCLVLIGSEDEANDPSRFAEVMQDPQAVHIIEGVKHLDIVQNMTVFKMITDWIQKEFVILPRSN